MKMKHIKVQPISNKTGKTSSLMVKLLIAVENCSNFKIYTKFTTETVYTKKNGTSFTKHAFYTNIHVVSQNGTLTI